MHCYVLLVLSSMAVSVSAWSVPQSASPPRRPHAPMRVTRFAALPDYQLQHHRAPSPVGEVLPPQAKAPRPKRDPRPNHDDDDHIHNYGIDSGHGHGHGYHRGHHDHHRDHHDHDQKGITGPVHTFIKTDKNANYKWGVRHHVGNKYAS